MLAVIGETKLDTMTMATIHTLVRLEKTLYGGPLETGASLSTSSPLPAVVGSSFDEFLDPDGEMASSTPESWLGDGVLSESALLR